MERITSGEAVRCLVAKSGKSQRAIAGELGRSPTYLSNYLTGGHVPQLDTLAAIACACGHSVALLPGGVDIPPGAIVIDS